MQSIYVLDPVAMLKIKTEMSFNIFNPYAYIITSICISYWKLMWFYIHIVLCLLLWIMISSCNRHKAWIHNLINNKKEIPHFIPTLRPRNRTWPVVRSPWAYGSLSSVGSFLFLPEVTTILTFQIISLLFCFDTYIFILNTLPIYHNCIYSFLSCVLSTLYLWSSSHCCI